MGKDRVSVRSWLRPQCRPEIQQFGPAWIPARCPCEDCAMMDNSRVPIHAGRWRRLIGRLVRSLAKAETALPVREARARGRSRCDRAGNARSRAASPRTPIAARAFRSCFRSTRHCPVPGWLRAVLSPSPGARAARVPRGRRRAAQAPGRPCRSGTARWHARTPRGRCRPARRSRTPAPGRRT